MKHLLLALIVTLPTSFSLAGVVNAEAPRTKGINEPVTIQYLRPNWGFTFQMSGFNIGTGTVRMVPVTRDASKVFQSLDRKLKYNCILEDSTFVPAKDQSGEGTYYVIDINCN